MGQINDYKTDSEQRSHRMQDNAYQYNQVNQETMNVMEEIQATH